MKKINKIFFVLILCYQSIIGQVNNSNWTHVGPKSNNNLTGSEFETGYMSKIAVDPSNALHLFTASKSGGLWESIDRGANWVNVNTNFTGYNGISDIAFINSTEILVGNYQIRSFSEQFSSSPCKYNFSSQTWTLLGNLTLPLGGPPTYAIRSVAVHPLNASIFYVSTSVGLYRSIDSGLTWTLTLNGCIENVVFMPKNLGLTSYYCYAAGSTLNGGVFDLPTGIAMLKESSDDGLTFTDLSSNITSTLNPIFLTSHSMVVLGPVNTGTGNRELLVLTLALKTAGANLNWDKYDPDGKEHITRVVKNINTFVISNTGTTQMLGFAGPRMAIAYDPLNNLAWYGGYGVNYFNLATNTNVSSIKSANHATGGNTHFDIKDIKIQSYGGVYEMYVASDGGIVRTALNVASPVQTNIYFNRLNNGLDMCAINGFSGASDDPNLYVIGSQDIVNTDIYDSQLGKNKYTHVTFENDGGLIDKFNNDLILMDYFSGNDEYYVSTDRGITKSGKKSTYAPKVTAPFEKDIVEAQAVEFSAQKFVQDPYRKGRIFSIGGKKFATLVRYDYTNQVFVKKNKFVGSPYFPNAAFEPILAGLSFSPQTPNSVYAITGSRYYPTFTGESISSRIYKYMGSNFDDCWIGHNEYLDASSNLQWADITPDFTTLSVIGGGAVNIAIADLGKASFTSIETSPWNKDIIYLACAFKDNISVKVMKFDGVSWVNYSTGIPSTEYAISMVMDHASNDGIYLFTDKAVYFRDKSMNSWINFSIGYPMIPSRQVEINYKENTVRAGTYGRGIFKSQLICPAQNLLAFNNISLVPFVNEATDITATNTNISNPIPNQVIFRATNSITLNPGFIAEATVQYGGFQAFIHGCSGGSTSTPNYFKIISEEEDTDEAKIDKMSSLIIFPNPNNGIFTVILKDKSLNEFEGRHYEENDEQLDEVKSVFVYNSLGRLVYTEEKISPENTELLIDMQNQSAGIYFLKVIYGKETKTAKFIVK
jgi:Secretion system C-terminal sorting domain